MIQIGKTYIKQEGTQVRLCADILMEGHGTTLWFGVAKAQERYLCKDRSDAFIMAMLPAAMRGRHDIECETAASARLCYQLENILIPSLASAGTLYHPIKILAPRTSEKVHNLGAVGTGFSSGVDSLYSIMTHGEDSEFPLTHIAVFNSGVFEGAAFRSAFERSAANAELFAKENNLQAVGLDSNLAEILPERFLDVYTFRNLACAMALQGLLSVYLLSSSLDIASFCFDLREASSYDLLTIHSSKTESLSVYLSGCQVKRVAKIREMSKWPPSYSWMHPCFKGASKTKNCGRCKKCVRDLVALYALDALDLYDEVFDIAECRKSLPQKIGLLMACQEDPLCRDAIDLLKESGKPIPESAYIFAAQFRRAINGSAKKGGDSD